MYEYENEGFYICADNIQDPGNVGNIFRTASAFELSGVILYKHCADPFGPKAIRGSVGQSLILPAIQIDELDLLNDMKKKSPHVSKYPLIYADERDVFLNSHYYYPFVRNK